MSAGIIPMRNPFWNSYFRNHVEKSKTHRDAVSNKKRIEIEIEAAKKKGSKRPPNNSQQLLPWAKNPKTSNDVRARVKAGVSLDDLGKGHSIQKDQVEEPSVAKIVNDCREAQNEKISENIVDKFPEGSICRGIMAQQDLVHPQIQRGLEHDMEYFAPREGLDAKQFEGFNHMRSLLSKSCLNREVKWHRPSKRRAFHALQCADCFKCVQPSQEGSQDLLKNFRRNLKKKAVLVDKYLSVSLGKIPFSSDEGKEAVCLDENKWLLSQCERKSSATFVQEPQ